VAKYTAKRTPGVESERMVYMYGKHYTEEEGYSYQCMAMPTLEKQGKCSDTHTEIWMNMWLHDPGKYTKQLFNWSLNVKPSNFGMI